MIDNRNLISEGLGETVALQRSPFLEGVLTGIKAGLLAAPIGAAVQALRGKSATTGGVVSALGAGLLAGAAEAGVQKLKNMDEEERIRYHVRNMLKREPALFRPRVMGEPMQPRTFVEGFSRVHP